MLGAETPAGPTRDELTLYQRLNLYRSAPRQGDNEIAAAIRRKQIPARLQVWNHQHERCAVAAPLVFDPRLAQAAQAVLAAGTKPVQGEPNEIANALARASYQPTTTAILLLARDAASLDQAYLLACTQEVGRLTSKAGKALDPLYAGTGLHRPELRAVGIAVSGGKDHWSLAVVLAESNAPRLAGGVAYLDANHNGRCDPGEGVAGARVAAGAGSMTTNSSGVWWLALADAGECPLSCVTGTTTLTTTLPAGAANGVVDWRVPNPADLAVADRLLAAVPAGGAQPAGGDDARNRKPLAALLSGTRMLALDPPREQRIATLVAPLQGDYQAALAKVLALLSEEPAVFTPQLATLQRRWEGAMPAWFANAEALYRLKRRVSAVATAPPAQQDTLRSDALAQLARTVPLDPVFAETLDTLREQLDELVPEAPEPAKKSAKPPVRK